MTAASLPQFKAVHNEWNIECKVRKKAQTTIWRQNIISQNMQAVLLTVKKGSRKRHNDLETNYDYDMQAVLSTVKYANNGHCSKIVYFFLFPSSFGTLLLFCIFLWK